MVLISSGSAYAKGAMYCKACGSVAKPQKVVQGSFLLELLLWLLFLVPGLIYSIWRLSNKKDACPKCRSIEVIPIDSPIARAALKSQPPL